VGSSAPLEKHVQDVLDQLDTNKLAFEKLSRELDGTMQLVGYFHDISPGIHFDQETVRESPNTTFALIATSTPVDKLP